MKYAIIESGGKQFQVRAGDEVEVELLESQEGESVEFLDVLFLQDEEVMKIGQPKVEGAKVKAEVVALTKGPKVIAYKYERRANEQTKRGHRQKYTRVRITEIVH